MTIWFARRPTGLERAALALVVPLVTGVAIGRAGRARDTNIAVPAPPMCAPTGEAGEPAPTSRGRPATSIKEIFERDPQAEVRDVRPGERLVLWNPQDSADIVWGGGARASLFVAMPDGWRHVGDIDSASDTSHVRVAFIDKVQGVAYLVEEFEGNGYPPSRAYAVAIVSGRADTITAGTVGDVDDDGDHELRLWRRLRYTYNYPERPLRASRWFVHRGPDGLTSTEIGLTPWIDVLDAFCSGAHPELATERARAQIAACEGAASVRWEGSTVVAELALSLYCGEDTGARDVYGALVLGNDRGRWRVTEVRGCED